MIVMYINKKDLINSINNCEHLDKDKIKNDEKGDHMIINFDTKDLSNQIAEYFENKKATEVDSSDIYEVIDEMIVDFLFYLYDCSKEEIEKKGIKVIE